jgi:hypothetical protein
MRSPKATDWHPRLPGAALLKRNFLGFVNVTAWRTFPNFLRRTTNDGFFDNFRR